MNSALLTDGYKLDHRRQYPAGTEYVYSNWTPRSNEYLKEAEDGAVVFGIQYFIKKYLIENFNRHFFNKPEDEAVASFKRRIDTFLGKNEVGKEKETKYEILVCAESVAEATAITNEYLKQGYDLRLDEIKRVKIVDYIQYKPAA